MKIWTEISEERLAANFRALERILSGKQVAGEAEVSLLAVVKANAYGHGVNPCAGVLASAGAQWLGVTDAHEGARVRAALKAAGQPASQNRGRKHPDILVMSGTIGLPGEAECIVRQHLTAVVWDIAQVRGLADAARAAGLDAPVRVHLEVDTGMSRQGVAAGAELEAVLRGINGDPRLELDGVLTHFASTEVAGSRQTAMQQESFEIAVAQVARAGLTPRWVHVGNSSYIDNDRDDRNSTTWLREVAGRFGARAMVRAGLALYGYLLPIEGPGQPLARSRVRPVMRWKTRLIDVREVRAGALVGYNGTFEADRPMRLALLPVGYADGLRRELSSTNARPGGWVMVRGEKAPIVGRVSMNLTTIDVSGIAGVAAGDEAVLLGDGVSADDHARVAATIPYDILCGVRTSE